MSKFILSCESTVDLPYKRVADRNLPILFYTYVVDGVEYVDDMGKDPNSIPNFYRMLDEGKMPSTSQINVFRYTEFFEKLLNETEGDICHIAFGSGLTPSVNNAKEAAIALNEQYPDRKIVVIDTLCASSGYGLFVDILADMRDAGKGMDEIVKWAEENKGKMHHQFFSTDMKFFKRSGRVSGPVATVASILGICPIMHLDHTGHIIAYSKARGKKAAIETTVKEMLTHAENGSEYTGKCYISNSNCLDLAKETAEAIKVAFPKIESIEIFDIGTIIASHCGPGTVAVFFMGDDRKPD